LTDGLAAEREQGITIDVAYRYFSAGGRRFIIADSPGHEQYTRNMATAASHCDLALILVDARNGVTTQTRRHTVIASLMGITHVVAVINKMDLVGYHQRVFEQIRDDYSAFAAKLDIRDLHFIPVSALKGGNVVVRSEEMPWYQGGPLLDYLQTVHIASDRNLVDLRLPVNYVIRSSHDYRGYAGTIASGRLRVGDEVLVLPSRKRSTVASILNAGAEVESSFAGQAVAVTLADEVDVSRGDVIVHPGNVPATVREFDCMMVWMDENEMRVGQQYLLCQGSATVPAVISQVRYRIDIDTLGRRQAQELRLNEIGRLRMSCTRSLAVDPYSRNRSMGGFILIDRLTNATVGAGMILAATADSPAAAPATEAQKSRIRSEDRRKLLGQAPATVWLTGLPKSGKSSVAVALEKSLHTRGHAAHVLDGSSLRQHLSSDLGFSADDRREQVRRLAAVARLCNDAGLITIVAAVSPYSVDRDAAIESIGRERFLQVYCSAPVEVCEARDPELYRRARDGELPDFTGVSAPYEPPVSPDLELPTHETSVEESVASVLELLEGRGFLSGR
jgi:bifunctional enzyme CysN/CysC